MNKTSYRNLIAKTKEIETYLHTHQTKTIEEIEDQIKHLEKMKINSINLLRKINDNIIKRYDNLINQLNNSKVNISTGISKINELNLQLVDIRNNYSSRKGNDDGISLDDKVSTLWKYIIGYQKEINRNINSINQSKMSDIKEIMDYKKLTFEVDNYLNIMKQKEYISEKINSPFYEIDFLSWCVRFFPFGTSDAQNKYISLFVGLISSENDYMKYEYEYKFELVNYSGKNNYVKNCVNEFRKNDAFKGYNKFYNIDKLEEEGFIGPNGQITKFVENGVEYNVGSAGYDTIRNASENSKIFKKLFDDTSKFENVFAIL